MKLIDTQNFGKDIREYNKLLLQRYRGLLNQRVPEKKIKTGLENFRTDVELELIIKEIENKVYELNPIPNIFQSNPKIIEFLKLLEAEDLETKNAPSKKQAKRYVRFTALLRNIIAELLKQRPKANDLEQIMIDKDIFILEVEIRHNEESIKRHRNKSTMVEQIDFAEAKKKHKENIDKMQTYVDLLLKEIDYYDKVIKDKTVKTSEKQFIELSKFRANKDVIAKLNYIQAYRDRVQIIHETIKK